MAKQRADGATRQIRVADELADKLGWLSEFAGETVAEIVDPILRPEVERRYEQIRSRVEIIEAARAGDPETILAPELGEAGA